MIIKKLSEAEQMREPAVGSYGQLMGSWKNAESYKWLIDGAEGQNRTVDTSLFRAEGKQKSKT